MILAKHSELHIYIGYMRHLTIFTSRHVYETYVLHHQCCDHITAKKSVPFEVPSLVTACTVSSQKI